MQYAVTGFPTYYRLTIRGVCFCAAVVIVLLAGISGCGMKSSPVPPGVIVPKAVSQLSVQRAGDGISLTWTMPVGIADLTGFRILRSELETGGADCPGCPREYLLLADLSPGSRQLVRESGGMYRYNDFTVRPGYLYAYRVAACYGSGNCSEAQDIAELKYDDTESHSK